MKWQNLSCTWNVTCFNSSNGRIYINLGLINNLSSSLPLIWLFHKQRGGGDDGLMFFSMQFCRQHPKYLEVISSSPADGFFLTIVVPLRIGIDGVPPDRAIASNPSLKEYAPSA